MPTMEPMSVPDQVSSAVSRPESKLSHTRSDAPSFFTSAACPTRKLLPKLSRFSSENA